jgi:Amino acid synthesis
MKIRKMVVSVEQTYIEMGQSLPGASSQKRALAMAVIENPYAGKYSENLDLLVEIGEKLGALLGEQCVKALGVNPADTHSYGKAAVVGEAGEIEHAAAILHPKLGAPLRIAVEKGAALVPSAKKLGGLGTAIDVPLGHKDAAFVRSHFDAIEARVSDAPKANEIMVAVAVTTAGRPLARVGGLQAHEAKGIDGLR